MEVSGIENLEKVVSDEFEKDLKILNENFKATEARMKVEMLTKKEND